MSTKATTVTTPTVTTATARAIKSRLDGIFTRMFLFFQSNVRFEKTRCGSSPSHRSLLVGQVGTTSEVEAHVFAVVYRDGRDQGDGKVEYGSGRQVDR